MLHLNMLLIFKIVISIVILQRLTELYISKKNEKWLLDNGAVEFGESHYKYIVLMHTCFFLALIGEYYYRFHIRNMNSDFNIFNAVFLVFFIILQIGRVWVITSLGKYWNTKIFRIPGSRLVNKGPYKFLRHPNYWVVTLEIFVLPLVFNLYYSMVIFTLWNLIMLNIRTQEENRALQI